MLVTGATGFIGSHLIETLAAGGHFVRCLVRKPPKLAIFASPRVQWLLGDITRPASLESAIAGVELVFHVAGQNRALSLREFRRGNLEGTVNLARACAACQPPPTFVYVSSLAAAGPALGPKPRIETDPAAPVSDYGRSKRAAERALEQFAGLMPISIVRPPSVFGPRDRYFFRLFQAVAWGWNVLVLPEQRLSLIHVHDLVDGLLRIAERGSRLPAPGAEGAEPGRGFYYLARPESPLLSDLGQMAAAALEVRPPRTLRLPWPVSQAAALLNETLAIVLGEPAYLGTDKMREAMAGSWTCSADRARAELNWRVEQDLPSQLRETARWYRQHGWL